MSLIEHARDGAALPPDRSETVVPIGLANGTISDHGKHPVESREALAFGDHLFKLWSAYVPDVCPYFSGWTPYRLWVSLGRDGGPYVNEYGRAAWRERGGTGRFRVSAIH